MTRARDVDWGPYVDRYHDERPGITEDVLGPAHDEAGRSPYDWLLEAVPARGTVVDIGCGSAPLGHLLGRPGVYRYLGIDRSQGELGRARARAPGPMPLVRGDATALPLGDATSDAVVASMVLMVLPHLDAVLAEVRRVLRPGGRLVATVPVRSAGDEPSMSVFRELLAALGQSQLRYPGSPTPSALADAGLELDDDCCGGFTRTVGPEDCELVVDSFYAIGAGREEVAEALTRLRARAAAGPFPLVYPIRGWWRHVG